ncbi:hypothetical protein ACHAXS_001283 [Conticribra weissflogii]
MNAFGTQAKSSSCNNDGIGNNDTVDYNRNTSHEHSKNLKESDNKRVRFSDTSSLRIYSEDYSYSKAYSKEDRIYFKKRVIADASKIRRALASSAISYDSTSPSHRLESCGIKKEEVIGLESLTLEKSLADIKKLRQLLTKSVLLEQEKQRICSSRDDSRIALLSSIMSGKSEKVARMRAAMAA